MAALFVVISGCSTAPMRDAKWTYFQGAWIGYGLPGDSHFYRLVLTGPQEGECSAVYIPDNVIHRYRVDVVEWNPKQWRIRLHCSATEEGQDDWNLDARYSGWMLRGVAWSSRARWHIDLANEKDFEKHLFRLRSGGEGVSPSNSADLRGSWRGERTPRGGGGAD